MIFVKGSPELSNLMLDPRSYFKLSVESLSIPLQGKYQIFYSLLLAV
jgi:hypothetical protein